jgi:hypothetical protein
MSPDDYLDKSFDDELLRLELSQLPWIGRDYKQREKRLFVLGESVYAWKDTQGATKKPRPLRARLFDFGIRRTLKVRYIRSFERTVFLKNASEVQRHKLWGGVVYHNLVNRVLPSRQHRPTEADYLEGWRSFLELASLLQPDECVVYGLEQRKIAALRGAANAQGMSLPPAELIAAGRHSARTLVIPLAGKPLRMLFMLHPSHPGFSWRTWGQVLRHREFASSLTIAPGSK